MKLLTAARANFLSACLDGAPSQAQPWLEALGEATHSSIEPLADTVDRDGSYPKAGLDVLRRLGALGITVETDSGGLGFTDATAAAAVETVAHGCPSTAAILMFHLQVVRRTARHARPAVRHRDLSQLATGEIVGVSAWSEPGAGADKSAVATRMRPCVNGYVAHGHKSFCTGLEGASVVHALACVGDDTVPTFTRFGFDDTTVRRGQPYDLGGLRGSSTGDVYIDNAMVDVDDLFSEQGSGPSLMRDNHRVLMNPGLLALGVGSAVMHFLGRVMRGEIEDLRPTVDFQHTRMMLAREETRLAQAYALAAAAIRALAAEPADADLISLQVKVSATDAAAAVTDAAVALCGARGYRAPSPLERHLRDARAIRLMGPTNELINDRIGMKWSGVD